MTLIERRASAAAALAELEREQGVALLDGQPFDAERLAQCRAELAALDAAETETVRRERAAVASVAAQEREEARIAMGGIPSLLSGRCRAR